MKILYTATVLSHICQFHLPYMKALKESGNIIHVASHDNLAEKNGLQLRYCDKFTEIPFSRSPMSKDNIKAYSILKKELSYERYDLIICNTPMGSVVTRLAARKTRKNGSKIIYIAHGFHFYTGAPIKNWLVYYPIEKYMAKYCDMIITLNDEDYKLATDKKFKAKIRHIHGIGVDQDRYHVSDKSDQIQMREREELSDSDFIVLCTGELNENKNQKTLVIASSQCADMIPNMKILLAGNGPLRDDLSKMIISYGLEDRIRMLGYRTDLEKITPAVDVVVSCSKREGMPLNIIEAMLCAKPVAVSHNRGHNELVEEGKTGLFFDCNDSASLAEELLFFSKNKERAAEMGMSGLEKAKLYTVGKVKEELFELISELI